MRGADEQERDDEYGLDEAQREYEALIRRLAEGNRDGTLPGSRYERMPALFDAYRARIDELLAENVKLREEREGAPDLLAACIEAHRYIKMLAGGLPFATHRKALTGRLKQAIERATVEAP